MSIGETRESRVVIYSASLVLCLVGLARGLPIWNSARDGAREAVRQEQDALREISALRVLAPTLHDSLEARRAQLASTASRAVDGTTPTASISSLAQHIRDAASLAGLALTSMTLRPDSTDNGYFARPQVQGSAIGDVGGLMAFLGSIEEGQRLLRVVSLTVSQPSPSGDDLRPEELRIEFSVEAVSVTPRTRLILERE